jgi:3-oxoacyl-[acyl-carrier-protein] synthase I
MVYFIADNITSPLGFSSKENFDALLSGQTGIKQVNDKNIYPEPFQASLINSEKLNAQFSAFGEKDKFTRLEKMIIISISDALKRADIDIHSKKTLILLSSTKGNIDLLEKEKQHLFPEERTTLYGLGKIIRTYFGNPNEVIVLSNACISGVLALNTAALLINSGKYDNVVITGGDIITRFVVSGFMSFLSLSPTPCKPFDAARDGLSLGEGAGTVILSKKNKNSQAIQFLGGASANDANHISGPSRTGEGSYIAIRKALAEAKIKPEMIDHISSHGTATLYNDEMESHAITRHGMQHVPVNSFKGSWGHTLGAAGIIETAAMLAEMRENILLGTVGFSKLGVSNPIHVVTESRPEELNTCLKMASGFGGSNAALVIQKLEK